VRETWEGWLRLLTKAERFPPPNHSEQCVRVAWTSLDRSLPPRRLPPRLTIEPGYRQWRAEIRSYQEAANARVKRLAKA